jgi:hypothetical protein
LDAFAEADPGIAFNATDLPNIEQKSRDLESSKETRALLFSSGQTFELRLLFTQAQAMGYAGELAAALAGQESEANRRKFLEDLSHRCDEFQDQLMKHFAVQP